MVHKVYTIRDTKGGEYKTPFFQKSHGEAERFLALAKQNPESMISKFPQDFDLFYLGEFDAKSGKFNGLETPEHLIKAIDLPI